MIIEPFTLKALLRNEASVFRHKQSVPLATEPLWQLRSNRLYLRSGSFFSLSLNSAMTLVITSHQPACLFSHHDVFRMCNMLNQ